MALPLTCQLPALLCFSSVPRLCFSSLARKRGCKGKTSSRQRACRLHPSGVPEKRVQVTVPRNGCPCTANQSQTEEAQQRQWLGWNQDPPGQGPVQPAVGDPASAGALDEMIHRG